MVWGRNGGGESAAFRRGPYQSAETVGELIVVGECVERTRTMLVYEQCHGTDVWVVVVRGIVV